MQCWIFFKKIKKNTRRYYFTPVYQKYWYDPQFLRYRVWQTEIGHYESFYALLPLPTKTKKIRILKKKKNYRRYHHFICTPKTTIIWGMLLEIQSELDRIFVILWQIPKLIAIAYIKTRYQIFQFLSGL